MPAHAEARISQPQSPCSDGTLFLTFLLSQRNRIRRIGVALPGVSATLYHCLRSSAELTLTRWPPSPPLNALTGAALFGCYDANGLLSQVIEIPAALTTSRPYSATTPAIHGHRRPRTGHRARHRRQQVPVAHQQPPANLSR
jgi:hypothetical protein